MPLHRDHLAPLGHLVRRGRKEELDLLALRAKKVGLAHEVSLDPQALKDLEV